MEHPTRIGVLARPDPSSAMSKNLLVATWTARVVTALILLQTAFFKLTGAPESIHIFEAVGMEPWGRIGSGVVELLAAVLLLIPGSRFAAAGAGLALGVIAGAIFSHLTSLGIEVEGDGGLLFGMALVVLAGSVFTLAVHRRGLIEWLHRPSPCPAAH